MLEKAKIEIKKIALEKGDSTVGLGVGGLDIGTGFFFSTTGGFGCIGFSIGFGFGSTGDSDIVDIIIGAVERGSPRRLSRTDFSAYSLI